MQRRNYFIRVKIAALGFFLIPFLYFNNSNVVSASTVTGNVKTGKTDRHFILLLDSKVAVDNISQTSKGSKSDDFFNLLKDALGKNPYHIKTGEKDNDNDHDALDYKSYEQGRDIVSIVLHNFSSTSNKNPAYFYTFMDIIFIEKFFESKSASIESLKRDSRYSKYRDAIPPEKIGNAEEIVLPYLCDKHNKYKKNSKYIEEFRKFEKNNIEDIIIISVYDREKRENITSEPDEEWKEFNNNFEYKRINRDLKSDGKKIAIDYFSVKPRHKKDISILAADKDGKYQLERYAKQSPTLHYWQGKSGLDGLPQGYRLQWAAEPGPGDIQWKDIGDIIDENAMLYLAENYKEVYIKSAYIKESEANKDQDDNQPAIKIYYKMIITDFKPGGNLQYPFKYSPAIEIKSITYQLQEVEKYALGFPWIRSEGHVNEKDLEKSLLTLKLDELSAKTAAENSETQALIELSAVYAAILLVLFVLYLYFYRNPKIKFDVKPVEEVPVDFSQGNRETKELAYLEWQNTRKWLSKFKKRKTFDVNLEVEWNDQPGGKEIGDRQKAPIKIGRR